MAILQPIAPKKHTAGLVVVVLVFALAKRKSAEAAAKSCAEGIRLFKLAGRPSQRDFVKVYGPNGPKMTWEQRVQSRRPGREVSGRAGRETRAVRVRLKVLAVLVFLQAVDLRYKMSWQVFTIVSPGREMCDFCSASSTARLYACWNFIMPRTKHAAFRYESIGAWSAFDRCAIP
jgi:hypothetical protein